MTTTYRYASTARTAEAALSAMLSAMRCVQRHGEALDRAAAARESGDRRQAAQWLAVAGRQRRRVTFHKGRRAAYLRMIETAEPSA